jgi:S1-C subfamily serine protease
MTRTRLTSPSLPLFLLAAAVVAILAFGLTRWIAAPDAGALPALDIAGDTAAAAPGALDPTKLYAQRVNTVVAIESTAGDVTINGSGVVVDASKGLIITASHVVKDYDHAQSASLIVVHFQQGDEVQATLRSIDQFNDLAILQVDPSQVHGLVAAPLGDSDQVLVGAEVAAIGAPMGFGWSQSVGHVSFVHRNTDSRINRSWKIADLIQHDASVNTGNSGGPLFNARGEVIGINQQIATPSKASAGVNFAVSSNTVKRAIAYWQRTGSSEIKYADLGLATTTLSPQLAAAAKIQGTTSGAMVTQATGPARDAGLGTGTTVSYLGKAFVTGDVITGLAGVKITSSDDLMRVAAAIDPDAPQELTFVRYGKSQTTKIDPIPMGV